MITEKELFSQGWRRFGDNENDPYYQLILDRSVFGLAELSGNFVNGQPNDSFCIYSMRDRIFNNIEEIKLLIEVNRFIVDLELANKYGSKEIK